MAGGGLGVHTNSFVESWGLRREVVERTFRWTPRSLSIIVLTGVLLPLAVYKIGVAEFVRPRAAWGLVIAHPLLRHQAIVDKRAGKTPKSFL